MKGRDTVKRIFILCLAFTTVFSSISFGAMFGDVEGHWAKQDIEALSMEGVINGMQDGLFAPDDFVTREQFLKMLLLVTADDANVRVNFEHPPKLNRIIERSPFEDVSSERWSYYYIKAAYGTMLFSEEYGTAFEPVKDITREEAAVWMSRALALGEEDASFVDADKIGHPGLVGAAAKYGLILGFDDGTFRPADKLTRAQAAVMLRRAGREKARRVFLEMTQLARELTVDLNGDGADDSVEIYTSDDRYVLCVNDLQVIGGLCNTANSRYFRVDVNADDAYQEIAVIEEDYNAGALAIYRYTGGELYMMGYIETVGDIRLRTKNEPIGDDWGAVSINADGTITANIGEQFVHTMLLRKQFSVSEKGRLMTVGNDFYTIGTHSNFTVSHPLTSPLSDEAHPPLTLEAGYAGKIVKTDLHNWLYIETGSGDAGWIYVSDDGLVGGEPLSYYLDGLWYAG